MKIFQRVLHALAVVSMVVGLSLLGFLVPVIVASRKAESLTNSTNELKLLGVGVWVFTGILIVLGAIAIWKTLRWSVLLMGLALTGGLMFYFWRDVPQPQQADLGRRVSDDDEGYKIVMWLAEDSPHSRLKEVGAPLANTAQLYLPANAADWPAFVCSHRNEIDQAWAEDIVGRAWIEAIIAHPPAGVWLQTLKGPTLSFQALRTTSHVRLEKAYALALDGQFEEAMQLLISMTTACQHLQRTAPCLINQMISGAVLKLTYNAAAEILKLGSVPDGTKRKLEKTLQDAPTMMLIFRNAYLGGQEYIRGSCSDLETLIRTLSETDPIRITFEAGSGSSGFSIWLTRARLPFLLNLNRTEAAHMAFFQKTADFATARQLQEIERLETKASRGWTVKNSVGDVLLRSRIRGSRKVVEYLWQVEDVRQGLLKQLEKP
jgi:hypothetical protein